MYQVSVYLGWKLYFSLLFHCFWGIGICHEVFPFYFFWVLSRWSKQVVVIETEIALYVVTAWFECRIICLIICFVRSKWKIWRYSHWKCMMAQVEHEKRKMTWEKYSYTARLTVTVKNIDIVRLNKGYVLKASPILNDESILFASHSLAKCLDVDNSTLYVLRAVSTILVAIHCQK